MTGVQTCALPILALSLELSLLLLLLALSLELSLLLLLPALSLELSLLLLLLALSLELSLLLLLPTVPLKLGLLPLLCLQLQLSLLLLLLPLPLLPSEFGIGLSRYGTGFSGWSGGRRTIRGAGSPDNGGFFQFPGSIELVIGIFIHRDGILFLSGLFVCWEIPMAEPWLMFMWMCGMIDERWIANKEVIVIVMAGLS